MRRVRHSDREFARQIDHRQRPRHDGDCRYVGRIGTTAVGGTLNGTRRRPGARR
ncbi:MAG TPA: hypothetical protein VIU62_15755 [Chloroflexota bacterium]